MISTSFGGSADAGNKARFGEFPSASPFRIRRIIKKGTNGIEFFNGLLERGVAEKGMPCLVLLGGNCEYTPR